jgi:hypothetical protein
MKDITRIGLDTSKSVFQLHGDPGFRRDDGENYADDGTRMTALLQILFDASSLGSLYALMAAGFHPPARHPGESRDP